MKKFKRGLLAGMLACAFAFSTPLMVGCSNSKETEDLKTQIATLTQTNENLQKEEFVSIWTQLPTCDPVAIEVCGKVDRNASTETEDYNSLSEDEKAYIGIYKAFCGQWNISPISWGGYSNYLKNGIAQLVLTIKDTNYNTIYQIKSPGLADSIKQCAKLSRDGDIWKYNVWSKGTNTSDKQIFSYYNAEVNYKNGVFKSVKLECLSLEKTADNSYSIVGNSNYRYNFDSTKTDATRWTKTTYQTTQYSEVISAIENIVKENYTVVEVKNS